MAKKKEGGTPISVHKSTTKLPADQTQQIVKMVMDRLQWDVLSTCGKTFHYSTVMSDVAAMIPPSECNGMKVAPLSPTAGVWVTVSAPKIARTGGPAQEEAAKRNGAHGSFTATFKVELGYTDTPNPAMLLQMCERIIVRHCRAYVITMEDLLSKKHLLDCISDKRSVWHKLEASWDASNTVEDEDEAVDCQETPPSVGVRRAMLPKKERTTWLGVAVKKPA